MAVPVRVIFFNSHYPSEDTDTIADQPGGKMGSRRGKRGKTREALVEAATVRKEDRSAGKNAVLTQAREIGKR